VAWQFLRFIMLTKRVDSNVPCTGVAAFLLVALLWSFIYQLIALREPGAFTFMFSPPPSAGFKGMAAVYFSVVTLCTVGYGDIVPVSDVARLAAMMEGVAGCSSLPW
jgi:voltage-gated potassium channel